MILQHFTALALTSNSVLMLVSHNMIIDIGRVESKELGLRAALKIS